MQIRRQFTVTLKILLLSICLSLHATAQENSVPQLNPITITYTINLVGSKLGNATLGQLEAKLTNNNGVYSASSATKAQGLAAVILGGDRYQNCEFSIEPGHALSLEYVGSTKKSTQFEVSYDWENRKINFADGESLDMPSGHITDTCNMPFAVAVLKEKGLTDNVLYVLEGSEKRIRGYKLRSSNQETLETSLGSMDTLKIVLEREFNADRTLSLWLSLEHDYVPVKMEDSRSSRTTTTLVNKIES